MIVTSEINMRIQKYIQLITTYGVIGRIIKINEITLDARTVFLQKKTQ